MILMWNEISTTRSNPSLLNFTINDFSKSFNLLAFNPSWEFFITTISLTKFINSMPFMFLTNTFLDIVNKAKHSSKRTNNLVILAETMWLIHYLLLLFGQTNVPNLGPAILDYKTKGQNTILPMVKLLNWVNLLGSRYMDNVALQLLQFFLLSSWFYF